MKGDVAPADALGWVLMKEQRQTWSARAGEAFGIYLRVVVGIERVSQNPQLDDLLLVPVCLDELFEKRTWTMRHVEQRALGKFERVLPGSALLVD